MPHPFYDASIRYLDGTPANLRDYAGKVILAVNVASQCGFTPQYAGLEKLWQTYKDQGLVVLGFPCNQFGAQEAGDASQIAAFCSLNYGVSFPLFEKIEVNGEQAHPIYVWLKSQATGILGTEAIKWNFTKFLISQEGSVLDRFASVTTPAAIEEKIVALLAVRGPA